MEEKRSHTFPKLKGDMHNIHTTNDNKMYQYRYKTCNVAENHLYVSGKVKTGKLQ